MRGNRAPSTLPLASPIRKLPTTKHDGICEPLVGSDVLDAVQTGGGDLSDWMELMEAVEALCPVWPRVTHPRAKPFDFRL